MVQVYNSPVHWVRLSDLGIFYSTFESTTMVLVDGQNFKIVKKSELLHNMMHAFFEENT